MNHRYPAVTRNAADRAYEEAGIGPEDLDLVELHDCFATAELLHYENLRLCAAGSAAELIESRATWRDGRIPVNVSGGLRSKGHPIGMTGVAGIYEIATHLRGEAGERYIQGAKSASRTWSATAGTRASTFSGNPGWRHQFPSSASCV